MSQYAETIPAPIFDLVQPEGPEFLLDREEAKCVIASRWGLDVNDRDSWWIGGFGAGLADSVELLTNIVFSHQREIVDGPGSRSSCLPVVPDSPAHPLMIGLRVADGPIVCHGIEDLAETLPDPYGRGPDHVLDALEALLALATSLIPEVERLASPPEIRSLGQGSERARRRRP